MFDCQSHDVHKEVNFFLLKPSFITTSSSLQITQQVTLITVLSHKNRLLSELVNILKFDNEFAVCLARCTLRRVRSRLNGSQFLVKGLYFARLSLEHTNLGIVNTDHLLGSSAESHIGRVSVVMFIFYLHFSSSEDQVFLDERLREYVDFRLNVIL